MSALPKPRKLTVAEYLALEETSELKHEFFDGERFVLSGATPNHNAIKDNLVGELGLQLRGHGHRTYSSDQRTHIDATGLFTYPDILIVCGRAEYDPADRNSIINPRVLVEILSPSTAGYDRGTKFRHYQRLTSVQEVVFVAQDQVHVERFVRQPDGSWNLTTFDDPAGAVALTSVPAVVPLAAVYRDVELPERPPLR
jgi:Uma2 family endonuclease